MNHYANIEDRKDLLESITTLEKELSTKTGKEVAVVAYSPIQYSTLNDDADILSKITQLEQDISQKLGKDIILIAFSL